jgi:Circularly permutated YpsA SLOG family
MKTVEFARKHGKPWLHLHFEEGKVVDKLGSFVSDNGIEILNVAGPRASKEPKLGAFVIQMLDLTFGSKKKVRQPKTS